MVFVVFIVVSIVDFAIFDSLININQKWSQQIAAKCGGTNALVNAYQDHSLLDLG